MTWKAARAGIITGVLLAVARISGETAPLLFTALEQPVHGHRYQPADGLAAGGDLPFAISAYEDQHALAWAGALLVTATVLALSIIARLLEQKRT